MILIYYDIMNYNLNIAVYLKNALQQVSIC
jgi:hypothetical protein